MPGKEKVTESTRARRKQKKWRLSEERRQSLRNMPVTEQKRRRFWIEERGPDSW